MRISGNQLVQLTGRTWRTITRRLTAAGLTPQREGSADTWDSVAALEAIYGIEVERASELDLTAERAALAKAQRIRIETEQAVRAGELVEVEAVAEQWSAQIHACRARLLALPHRLAPRLVNLDSQADIAAQLRREVHDALRELAGEQGGDQR